MQPISRYYSSRSHPMPANVEDSIERLPIESKIKLAIALLQQFDSVMQSSNRVTPFRNDRVGDHAS